MKHIAGIRGSVFPQSLLVCMRNWPCIVFDLPPGHVRGFLYFFEEDSRSQRPSLFFIDTAIFKARGGEFSGQSFLAFLQKFKPLGTISPDLFDREIQMTKDAFH